ncbi:MAG: hypothetical protein OEW99_05785 [Gammaproteobacteria bacterium]|nr:hypothetical protein [Gammaproteobacteria bacterium]
MNNPDKNNDVIEEKNDLVWGLFFLIFGLYLVAGAITTFINNSWPAFMPLQFDFIVLITKILGETISIIIGSFSSLIWTTKSRAPHVFGCHLLKSLWLIK